MNDMPNPAIIERNAILLALGLSVEASRKIREKLHDDMSASGALTAFALQPLVPLIWCRESNTPFELIAIPRMPRSIVFDVPITTDGFLFLGASSPQWNNLVELIREILARSEKAASQDEMLFPAAPGILLGPVIEKQDTRNHVLNSDWRLLRIRCFWIKERNRIIHFRHLIEFDRHLT